MQKLKYIFLSENLRICKIFNCSISAYWICVWHLITIDIDGVLLL